MSPVFAVEISDIYEPATVFPTFGDLVSVIVRNAFVVAGVIAFLLLIFGGFRFIVAAGSGDTKQLESGKKAMTGAVIGLLIVVASVWIVQILEKLTGLPLLRPK